MLIFLLPQALSLWSERVSYEPWGSWSSNTHGFVMLSLIRGCFMVQAMKTCGSIWLFSSPQECLWRHCFSGEHTLHQCSYDSLQTSGLRQEFPHLPREVTRSPKWYEQALLGDKDTEKWYFTILVQPCAEKNHFVSSTCRGFLLTRCSALKGGDILPPADALLLYKKCFPKSKWI